MADRPYGATSGLSAVDQQLAHPAENGAVGGQREAVMQGDVPPFEFLGGAGLFVAGQAAPHFGDVGVGGRRDRQREQLGFHGQPRTHDLAGAGVIGPQYVSP